MVRISRLAHQVHESVFQDSLHTVQTALEDAMLPNIDMLKYSCCLNIPI